MNIFDLGFTQHINNYKKTLSLFKRFKNIQLVAALVIPAFFSSCTLWTTIKKEPKNAPFIYETTVKIADNTLKKAEKSRLEAGLTGQLDDSLISRKLDKVFWAVLKKPAKLDSSYVSKSIQYMHYYLNGEGYYHDSITQTTTIKNTGTQQRAYITILAWPGKVTTINPLTYTLNNDSLQALTNRNLRGAIIKTGDPFARSPISNELDRLVDVYHENGYIKFSRNMLYGLWDTVDVSLLQPAIDPFEQAQQLEKLKAKTAHPEASLDLRLRPVTDSTFIEQYHVGNIIVYPDAMNDFAATDNNSYQADNITVMQRGRKFNPKIFPPNIYLKHGDLYNQRRYNRTVSRFNTMGNWRQVDLAPDFTSRAGQDTVDFIVKLYPSKKYSFTSNVEGSFSQSVLSGNFVGLGYNIGLQNRNFLKGANLASINVGYLVELGQLTKNQFIQTQQVNSTAALSYPRFIFPGLHSFKNDFRGSIQSRLTLNAANTERRDLFNLTSINGSWGYNFSWRDKAYNNNNKVYNLTVKIPNIEYSNLIKRDSLDRLIAQNPAIKNLFTDGLISSVIVNLSMPWTTGNGSTSNIFRANLEQSGLLTGLIKNSFIDENLYRFIKFDLEYARMVKFTKSALVLRAFAGLGYEFNNIADPEKRAKLPFFKEYYSGGPNSMRAWQIRRLGPGSTIQPFEGSSVSIPDRFGDVQLEGNIEYRTPLANIAGIQVNGALFTDIGNVWFLKKEAGSPEEVFKLSRLGTDIAIGSGAGVRVDFGFFVLRLDYAYKVKDPSPSPEYTSYQNKFFAYPFFKGSQLQIGISYPFIF